jgi:glycosyltransferase involved in cell wall biosynthesis
MTSRPRPRPRDAARRPAAPTHILAIVENVPFSDDTRLRKQVDSLLEHGYRVSVVTRGDERNAPFRRIPGLRLLEYRPPREGSGLLAYAREYVESLVAQTRLTLDVRSRDRVDVVQFCQPPDLYVALALLMRALGSGIVVDQRDLLGELYAARFGRVPSAVTFMLRTLDRWSYRTAHAVMCVNGYLERYVRSCGVAADRVTVVRNGPVLGRLDRSVASPELRPAARLCCWVGKMGRQDRLDLLLEAMDQLVHRLGRDDVHLAILGDGECLGETRALATRLGLDPYVTFTGWVEEDVVFRYLATADLGLDASMQQEVSPVKAMEYMGAGLPLVAFDLPETRALCDGSAVLVPPGNVDALALAMSRLLDDPNTRRRMGNEGRERVARALAWEHQETAYLAVIDGVVRRVPRGVRRAGYVRA